MRDTVPRDRGLSLNLGASVLEKDVEVARGRVGGRQGCNAIVSPSASCSTRANLHGAVKHRGREGDRLAGWEDHLEAVVFWDGGISLGCRGKPSSLEENNSLFCLCWDCGAHGWIRTCLGDMKPISLMVLINGKDEAGRFHLPEQVWGQWS